ncbi:chemotaxis protein CheW [Ectothiorhodospira lacustris]|uniref:chemotaxis protein CheW n=1 Tax=Ectothiorhodospira lacustris TaxID=2899127 RepID=UPI001EE8ED64|nr:chemotaxis protein CheW [Ectothiorhodospira lacustris]MCG5500937.1 chemotaxis protein CheW [Ectothiorhodospira lacustris]MCG5510700.1 chemotaxis protein CheW [Ectothiorhodospira lacustris]MCG5522400.1 chemotaxis protein CheW [Ectothiorhodospira lacustris]
MKALKPREQAPDPAGDVLRQYLSFMLKGDTYAIGILHIKEIIEYDKVTSVPMVPDFIRGVINLRGAVVPVIDLARRFGKNASQINRRTCIVLVELTDAQEETHVLGLVVDAVNEVLEITDADVLAPPTFGARIRTDFIQGMGRVGEDFVIILRLDQILSSEEMQLLSQVGELPSLPSGATHFGPDSRA